MTTHKTQKQIHILLALDSFKGSISAQEAQEALERGLTSRNDKCFQIHCSHLPISDGGEGFLHTIHTATIHTATKCAAESPATQWNLATTQAHSPYGRQVLAHYLYRADSAILEMAQSSGLTLTPMQERRTLLASSYGFGEVMREAYAQGARHFILGIGGSASTDGGVGFLQALGVRFYDKAGRLIEERASGIHLQEIAYIEDSALLQELRACDIAIASDVSNPLLGEQGASYVYATQKGVEAGDIERLEAGMRHYAALALAHTRTDLAESRGDGAAGGMGFALRVFLGAKMQSGIETFLTLTSARELVEQSDLIITGEGRIDSQSAFGKAISGVAQLAREAGKPIIAVAGALGEGYEELHARHISAMFALTNAPMSVERAMADAASLLEQLGRQLAGVLRI